MSEATPEGGNTNGETPAVDEFKPVTSQEALNHIIAERVRRVEAKYADVKDLRVKASKLDEIEQANKSEAQKAADRITSLEAELASLSRSSQRIKIAAEHGITDADDIELFLTGSDAETLTKQAKRLAERTADRKSQGNHVPREGKSSTATTDENRTAINGLFNRS